MTVKHLIRRRTDYPRSTITKSEAWYASTIKVPVPTVVGKHKSAKCTSHGITLPHLSINIINKTSTANLLCYITERMCKWETHYNTNSNTCEELPWLTNAIAPKLSNWIEPSTTTNRTAPSHRTDVARSEYVLTISEKLYKTETTTKDGTILLHRIPHCKEYEWLGFDYNWKLLLLLLLLLAYQIYDWRSRFRWYAYKCEIREKK